MSEQASGTNVTIIDYGMGNLSSVASAFKTLGAKVEITDSPEDIRAAERVVLPGVGAFGRGMEHLKERGLIPALEEHALMNKKPFLGICLGLQLMAKSSQELGEHQGLGWLDATVEPLSREAEELKSIHIGWDAVQPATDSVLFSGLKRIPYYYFVHRYHINCQEDVAKGTASYGHPFTAAVEQGNLFGVQFHPEKSQEAGLSLLRNFLDWTPETEVVTPVAKETETRPPSVRLIPTLQYHKGRMTKTVQFELQSEGVRRDVGDCVKAPMVYDAQLADELILLDIRSTVEGRDIEELIDAVKNISGAVFMPLTAGGGIVSTEDIRRLLFAGADKVAVNSYAVEQPEFITEASKIFGSQCIVVSIDVRQVDGQYRVFTKSGTHDTGLDAIAWAKQAESLGAGEILLTSIEHEGAMQGFDEALMKQVADAVDIPVIASGGAGQLSDLASVIREGNATAVSAASLFHFRDQSPIKAKAFMKRQGLAIRD